MQIRLISKQAPRIVWGYKFQNSVVLNSVLQSYCSEHGLDAQHATISSFQGEAVSFDEVVHTSMILLVDFQPSFCFYIWYCLLTYIPKPFRTSWLDAYSIDDAMQFAVECASPLADAELLKTLKAVRPEQLLPCGCLPTADSPTDQHFDQEQPVLQISRAFLAGLLHAADRQTVLKSKASIVPPISPALQAIALVQQLLWLIQPLAPLHGRDAILMQIIDFLESSIHSSQVDTPLAMDTQSDSPSLPGSSSSIADTDQLYEAVMQTSVQLLQAQLQCGSPDPGSYTFICMQDSTVRVLFHVLRNIKGSSVLSNFCSRGGLELLVQLMRLKPSYRSLAAILHTIQTRTENKDQLTTMWHALLELGVLPLLAANLRPRFATGEENEAETGQRAFGQCNLPLLHAVDTSQHKHSNMVACLMLSFLKLQVNQQQRTSTYSLSVLQSVGARMLTKQHTKYKNQLGVAASDPLPCELSKQMEDLRMLAHSVTSSSPKLPPDADAIGLSCAENCPPQPLMPNVMNGASTDAQLPAKAPTLQPTSGHSTNAPAAVLTSTARRTAAARCPPSQCASADPLSVSHDTDDPASAKGATGQMSADPGSATRMLEATAAPTSVVLPLTEGCTATAASASGSASASASTPASVIPSSVGQAATTQAGRPNADQIKLTAVAIPTNTATTTKVDLLTPQDHAMASPHATRIAAVNYAEPDSAKEMVAAASKDAMTAADNSVQFSLGRQEAGTAITPIIGAQLNASLAEMVNCGVHSIGKHHLYQQHWPTPDAAAWDQTVKLAIQVAAVQEWLLSSVQCQKLRIGNANGDSGVVSDFAHVYAHLQQNLLVLLHMLVVGHVMDMSLDMTPLFENVFHVVTLLWSAAEVCHQRADVKADTSYSSQLGRAMLQRLVLDRRLALGLTRWGSLGDTWARRNLSQAVNGLFGLASTYQQASEELGCGIVATHPDWQLLLVALYDLITHLNPTCHKFHQHTTSISQLGQLLPQLEPNTAAQATAAACVCWMHATGIKLERNPAKRLRLCTAVVRSDALTEVWSVLVRTLLGFTDPSLESVEGSLPAARLLAQATALYQLLPEALQKELEGLPVCLRPWQQASAAEVEVVACAVENGQGIIQCMRTCAAAKQTGPHSFKSSAAAISRRDLVTATLTYLSRVVNAYYLGSWPVARYRVITDAAFQLVQALCPPAGMLHPAEANNEYLACLNKKETSFSFSLLLRSWLQSASEACPTQISTPTISLPRDPKALALAVLEYMQASKMLPQIAGQEQMLAFGKTCYVGCLNLLTQEADFVVAMSEQEDRLQYLRAEPKLSPLAVCLEGHDMYSPPGQGITDDSPVILTAMQSCAQYALMLLGLLTYLHGQLKTMTKEALLTHKQGVHLARDPSLEDSTRHDRLLDEAQARKEDAHQERQELYATLRMAAVELDKMIGVCMSLCHRQGWATAMMALNVQAQHIKNMTAQAVARNAILQTHADAILTLFSAEQEGSSLQQAEVAQQALLAEQEQAKAKAAAKKAKKQRQKAKKSQHTSPVLSANPATEADPASSSPKPATEPDPVRFSNCAVSSKSASTHQPDAVRDQPTPAGGPPSPAAIPSGPASTSAGHSQLQQELQHLEMEGGDDRQDNQFLEELFCCPLSKVLMVDPVIAADGHTYERAAIQQWLQTQSRSPVTSLPLSHTRLTPNLLVKSAIQTHMAD